MLWDVAAQMLALPALLVHKVRHYVFLYGKTMLWDVAAQMLALPALIVQKAQILSVLALLVQKPTDASARRGRFYRLF
jgi:hypothetical protein